MRVQTEEWRRFIPGIRMYKGKMTLFWNGEKLWEGHANPYLIYNREERLKWEVIIVLPGVEEIHEGTFHNCKNLKVVIMSNSVRRIKEGAFYHCDSLEFVKLSTNLEFIGLYAFYHCNVTSIFIPLSCQEIGRNSFCRCKNLIIFSVPENTQLGANVIAGTALIKASSFDTDKSGDYSNTNDVNEWIKNRHADNQLSLHRACSASNPVDEVIFDILQRQGIGAFNKQDSVGVTPSQYLSQNPFTEIKEHKIIKRYILEMMGEVI